jgi:hypothetical protein
MKEKSNNKQSSVEWFARESGKLRRQLEDGQISFDQHAVLWVNLFEKAKAMQQKQAHLYAAFVLKCVQNNLPPITFNDWINLDNNEQ